MSYLIFNALLKFVNFIQILIFVRVILSWVPLNRDNKFIQVLYILTEPLLGPIRNMINRSPLGGSMLDFSPILAFLVLDLVVKVVANLLF